MDATNAAICQTAIDLAHRFGSVAVAEGIESMTDLQALMVMGCDFGQGALVAPPMRRIASLGSAPAHERPRPQVEPTVPGVETAGRVPNIYFGSAKARPHHQAASCGTR